MKVKHLIVLSMLAAMGCNSAHEKTYTSFDDYPVYEGEWEEMNYSPEATRFSLWAPTAAEVKVLLYEAGKGGSAYRMVSMEAGEKGMWSVTVEGDLKGKFYAFNVRVGEDWQGDTPGLMAKAVGVNGDRAAVVDMRSTDPEGWLQDKRPSLKSFADMVVYEMHHRDFSIDTVSGIQNRGKFLALTEGGTHTFQGEKTGIDHLQELGVTHVQLMPSFDFSSVDETRLDVPQYNWGYDPKNYNVPEGSYSTDPYTPETRIREFKEMVMALHQAGIRVIMDVVYNHTSTIEGSIFDRTVPGYFYRLNQEGKPANGSGCGNETASERAMMRRFIVESVCYWVREYHVDGFRFDLMGLHDIETMKAVRSALDAIDPTIYIGGEGWAAEPPQISLELAAMKNNMRQLPGIAAFSGEFRDSLRGHGYEGKGTFVCGRSGYEDGIRFGLAGGVEHPQLVPDSAYQGPAVWAGEPTQFISYASCHDGLCITDYLKETMPKASSEEWKAMLKLTETAVLTSQGIPFLFAGDEIMRDRRGNGNPYNASDEINAIDWQKKTQNRDVFDYVRELIVMRKAHPAFRMGRAGLVRQYMEFLKMPVSNVIAFRLKGEPCGDSWSNITVILNARPEAVRVTVPEGKYRVVCRDGKIDLNNGLGLVSGGDISVAPRSALIMHQ